MTSQASTVLRSTSTFTSSASRPSSHTHHDNVTTIACCPLKQFSNFATDHCNNPFYTSSEIRNHMEKYHRDHELEASSHTDIIKQDMCVVRCNDCKKWLITHSIGQVGRPVFSGLNAFQQHYNHLCSSAVESVSNSVSVVVNNRLGKRRPLSPKALVGVTQPLEHKRSRVVISPSPFRREVIRKQGKRRRIVRPTTTNAVSSNKSISRTTSVNSNASTVNESSTSMDEPAINVSVSVSVSADELQVSNDNIEVSNQHVMMDNELEAQQFLSSTRHPPTLAQQVNNNDSNDELSQDYDNIVNGNINDDLSISTALPSVIHIANHGRLAKSIQKQNHLTFISVIKPLLNKYLQASNDLEKHEALVCIMAFPSITKQAWW